MKKFTANDPCFKCPCAECQADPLSAGIDDRMLIKLNMVCSQIESEDSTIREITITSGRRCKNHNKSINGSEHSMHLEGLAVDISTKHDPWLAYRVVDAAMVWNIPFVEVAKNHMHLDLREGTKPMLIIGPG